MGRMGSQSSSGRGRTQWQVAFRSKQRVVVAISAVGGVSLGGGGLSLQEARVDGWAEARGGSVESWPGGDQLAARNRNRQ